MHVLRRARLGGTLAQPLEHGRLGAVDDTAPRKQDDEAVDKAEQDRLVGDKDQGLFRGDGLAQNGKTSLLGCLVHGGRGFVEQPGGGSGEQEPGECDELLLPAGNAIPTLEDRHVQPLRMAGDELIQADPAAGVEQCGLVNTAESEREVVAQGAGEEFHVLRQIAQARGQVGAVDLLDVEAVEQHLPFARRKEAGP
jgi:hypothetical protein